MLPGRKLLKDILLCLAFVFLSSNFFFFIGVELLYNVLLVSAESVIHIHISTLFWILFPLSQHSAVSQFPTLYGESHYFSIYTNSVHMSISVCPFAPIPFFSPSINSLDLFTKQACNGPDQSLKWTFTSFAPFGGNVFSSFLFFPPTLPSFSFFLFSPSLPEKEVGSSEAFSQDGL